MTTVAIPKDSEGFACDIQHEKEFLRLFSTISAKDGGWTYSIFDVNTKHFLVPQEFAANAEDGMRKAEDAARHYLRAEPRFDWYKTPKAA